MMYTIALLATVVVSMSIEHPLVSETVLAKEFRPVSNGAFAQDAQVSNDEWFNQIPLKGKGPNGCDFSDMDIASLYHLRLVEAHPMYIACQRGLVNTNAAEQRSRNMKRDGEDVFPEEVASPREDDSDADGSEVAWTQYLKLHPAHFEEEQANKEATLTQVAELTKELETLKASLPAVSDGKIENLESYVPIRRQFKALLSKVGLLDIRYDQVIDLKKNIDRFSQTIDGYNDMADDMCITGEASYCVHFNHRLYHNELLDIQKKYDQLDEDMRTNKEVRTEELFQSFKSRFDALRARARVIFDVEIHQWRSFRSFYNTILGEISHTDFEVDQMLSFWEV